MKQVISPHIDDAIFSLGGSICNWLGAGEEVRIIYIFTRSNWTNPASISGIEYPKDTETVTALRKAEERDLQDILDHDTEFLDWKETGLRGRKTMLLDLLLHGSMPVTKNRMTNRIREQLKNTLDRNTSCFFPLGLGKWRHPDHVITREIGLSLLMDGFKVAIYEDLPYCTQVDSGTINGRFFDNIEFTPVYEEIDIENKIRLLEYYQSQMSPKWLTTARDYSFSLRNNRAHERYWLPG